MLADNRKVNEEDYVKAECVEKDIEYWQRECEDLRRKVENLRCRNNRLMAQVDSLSSIFATARNCQDNNEEILHALESRLELIERYRYKAKELLKDGRIRMSKDVRECLERYLSI